MPVLPAERLDVNIDRPNHSHGVDSGFSLSNHVHSTANSDASEIGSFHATARAIADRAAPQLAVCTPASTAKSALKIMNLAQSLSGDQKPRHSLGANTGVQKFGTGYSPTITLAIAAALFREKLNDLVGMVDSWSISLWQ